MCTGLITATVPWIEELDIIQFEHLTDTTEEYGTLDAVAADAAS